MSDLLLEIYSFEDKFDMDRMHTLSERYIKNNFDYQKYLSSIGSVIF